MGLGDMHNKRTFYGFSSHPTVVKQPLLTEHETNTIL